VLWYHELICSNNKGTIAFEWFLVRLLRRVELNRVLAPARQAWRTLAPARALVNRCRGRHRAIHVRAPAVALIRVLDAGHRVPHRLMIDWSAHALAQVK
jgi:hypothetical protein